MKSNQKSLFVPDSPEAIALVMWVCALSTKIASQLSIRELVGSHKVILRSQTYGTNGKGETASSRPFL